MASSATRCCNAARGVRPLRRDSTSRTTWRSTAKSGSRTQVAPAASSSARWVKRAYGTMRSVTRSHKAAWVMPGLSSQTPTIIIRLALVSMRSQAVSTLLMRSLSPPKPSAPCTVRPTTVLTDGLARRGAEAAGERTAVVCCGAGALTRVTMLAFRLEGFP